MNKLARVLTLAVAFCGAGSAAIGQTVVNSAFLGGDHKYSNPGNWSPAEVPNNSADKIYNVTTQSFLYLDTDATVANLSIAGQFLWLGAHSYKVAGTTTLDAKIGELSVGPGIFIIDGSLANFDPSTVTLTGGKYNLVGADGAGGATSVLRFPNANIVKNDAAISLFGAAAITDGTGRDALRNFTRNLAGGSFSVAGRDYPINGTFTNEGTLSVSGGQFAAGRLTMAGGLTNYDPQAKRLFGGAYAIFGSSGSTSGIPAADARLIVPGADIVRNSASITLGISGNGVGGSALFADENGNNALRNFTDNEAAGVFELDSMNAPFQSASDFINAGTVSVNFSSFQVPAQHVYRQVGAGTTALGGGTIDGDVEILGGRLAGIEAQVPNTHATIFVGGTVNGKVTVTDALFEPNPLAVSGPLQLSDSSRSLFRQTISRQGLSVQSTLSLAGRLEISFFAPSSSATYTIAHASAISGVFSNAPNGSRVTTMDGKGSFVVTYTRTDVTLSNYLPTPPIARLLNISTRAQVLTGNDVAIGGFIIAGSDPKNVVIRAMGPSLAQAGVTGPLQDPTIELHDSKGAIIATNDNWGDNQSSEISASGFAPTGANESATFAVLSPGTYTAIVRGKNNATGVTLVEVYDLSSNSQSRLANISTRGFVDADHVLIGGLIAGGNAQDTVHVVARAIGRGLQDAGLQNFLADPALEVRSSNGTLVGANDDFTVPSDNPATVPNALWPSNSVDAATGIRIPPGNYTVLVSGKAGQSGNALVEIYDLNN